MRAVLSNRPADGRLARMLRLTATIPSELTEEVTRVLSDSSAVSTLAVMRGAALRPVGDVVQADVAREGANAIVESLRDLGVHEGGTLQLEPVSTWVSRAGFEADEETPGSSADAVVWAEVAQRSYEESELNWTFLSFMSLATLIAGIAIVLDTQILVIGAMVLGPEFGAVAALGVALVRRRPLLLAVAARALAVGFAVAIAVTCVAGLIGRALGWVTLEDITGEHCDDERPLVRRVDEPRRGRAVADIIPGHRAQRRLHLGHDDSGSRQRRPRPRLRGVG